jgi:hypothetical protein
VCFSSMQSMTVIAVVASPKRLLTFVDAREKLGVL